MYDILLVSFGAILGANFRFLIYKKLEQSNLNKEFIILVINTLSSFLLGFFISFFNKLNYLTFSYQIVLFFSIGFLGSFSSFSTFIYDLFDLSIEFKFSRALKILIISLAFGIIALSIGFLWGNQ